MCQIFILHKLVLFCPKCLKYGHFLTFECLECVSHAPHSGCRPLNESLLRFTTFWFTTPSVMSKIIKYFVFQSHIDWKPLLYIVRNQNGCVQTVLWLPWASKLFKSVRNSSQLGGGGKIIPSKTLKMVFTVWSIVSTVTSDSRFLFQKDNSGILDRIKLPGMAQNCISHFPTVYFTYYFGYFFHTVNFI